MPTTNQPITTSATPPDSQASSLKPQASGGATPPDSQAPSPQPLAPPVYEVFRRDRVGAAMVHAGSVVADSPELALIYAREVYGRRGESRALWIAPRAAFVVIDDSDILEPALDHSYRLVEGYRLRDKLQAVRAARSEEAPQ